MDVMDCQNHIEYLREELLCYIKNNKLKSLVLGISGGIDSALVAALAKPVCDKLNIPLIGRSITIATNKCDEIERANMVGNAFCTDFKEVNLTHLYHNMCNDGIDEVVIEVKDNTPDVIHNNKIRKGNIKARIRMMYLYNLASAYKGMVLSTDNYTELLVGFWTIHGDVGDYGMIQQYWKGEVYAMASHIATEIVTDNINHGYKADALLACIKAVPTDGLGITNSDLDQLGASTYDEVDMILKTWLTDDEDSFEYDEYLKYKDRIKNYHDFVKYRGTLKDHPVIQRHIGTDFKRNLPINVSRYEYFD